MLKSLAQWQIESIDYRELVVGSLIIGRECWKRASPWPEVSDEERFPWDKAAPLSSSQSRVNSSVSFGG